MKVNHCILIVDDQQQEIVLVAEYLKGQGYIVTTASDGFKALAACKVKMPDVIILDLQMPLMNGVDVYNRLAADEKTKFIPVIFTRSSTQAAPSSREIEDLPIIIKPLEPQDVESLIKTVMQEKNLKDELRKKDRQINELALTDNLTSLRNTKYLNEFLKTELNQCTRYNSTFTVLSMLIDNAKDIVKAHGSKAMETLLPQIAAVMSRGLRKADILVRTGTHEFILALPFTNADGAIEVAEKIRTNIESDTFTIGEHIISSTISVGISQFYPEMDLEGAMLLSYARQAMNQAHENGGNQTFLAE